MDITTQQFLMGSAGGKDTYWITKIEYSSTSYSTGGNNGMCFTATGEIIISSAYAPHATLFKMNDTGVVAWYKSLAQKDESYEYYPKDGFNRVMTLSNGYIMQYGNVYDTYYSSRSGGIAVYDTSGNLAYQRELWVNSGAVAFTLRNAVQFSNGNIMYGSDGSYFNVMDSSGYASNIACKQEYRIISGGMAFSPPSYPGNWLQTDGSYAYCLGTTGVYNGSTGDYDYSFCFLTVDSSLNFAGSYHYRMPGYGNALHPFDFARTSAGSYVTFNSAGIGNYTFFLAYVTSSGVQWNRRLDVGSYVIGTGSIPLVCADTQGNAYVAFFNDAPRTILTVMKYDTTGAIVWKNNLSGLNSSANGIGYFGIYKNALYALAGGVLAKLSLTGNGLGTYGTYTYAASSQTDSTGPTLTQTSGGGSNYTSAYTLANASKVWTTPTITATATQYLKS